MTYQMFEMLFNIVFLIPLMAVPEWIRLLKTEKIVELRKNFDKILLLSVIIMLGGCVFIITLSSKIIMFFTNKDALLSPEYLYLLSLIFILQLIHSISGHFLTIEDDIPFANSSFITGLGVLVLSVIMIPLFSVYGMIIPVLLSQAIYNNWKWPYECAKFFRRKLL